MGGRRRAGYGAYLSSCPWESLTAMLKFRRIKLVGRSKREVRDLAAESDNLSPFALLPPLGENDLSRNSFASRARFLSRDCGTGITACLGGLAMAPANRARRFPVCRCCAS